VTKSGWDTAGGGKLLPSSEQLLQLDFAIVLHSCEVHAHRHREIIEEIHHLTGNTVPLSVEVVAADAQINGSLHTTSIGSTTVSLKVSGIHETAANYEYERAGETEPLNPAISQRFPGHELIRWHSRHRSGRLVLGRSRFLHT
jgi:hypothetical protein